MNPRVSVVLPVRNGMPYLPEALASLRCQTLPDFECLVIDDGSTDETATVAAQIAREDERFRVIRTDRQKIAAALNRGIAEAKAPLIARMDADDRCLPMRLETQVAYMDAHPDCVLLGSACVQIDEVGKTLDTLTYPVWDDTIRWTLYFRCPFLHPTVVYRADVVRDVRGYRPGMDCQGEDFDLWWRLAEKGRLHNLPDPLLEYRVHSAAASSNGVAETLVRCGGIAGEHAGRFFRDNGPELWYPFQGFTALHQLYSCMDTGRIPDFRSLGWGIDGFHAAERMAWRSAHGRLYYKGGSSGPAPSPAATEELREAISQTRGKLRRNCGLLARKALGQFRLIEALNWLAVRRKLQV